MAQSYTTTAGTLIIPGGYPTISVQTQNSNLGTNGVIAIIGESDGGPDWTLETDLSKNVFGPDQVGAVIAKYKSGRIVDAMMAVAQPSNDPSIPGAPNQIVIVKTNKSGKASLNLLNLAAGAYGTLYDVSYGTLGNLIQAQIVQNTPEVAPTTGALTFIPPVKAATANLRANGGSADALTVTAGMTPTAFVAAVAGLTGITATGGVNRVVLTSGSISAQNLSIGSVSVNTMTISASAGSWAVTPSVGDTLIISEASQFATGGGSSATFAGSYVVTAATASTITCTKLADDSSTGSVGTITAPTGAGYASTAATVGAFTCYSPVVISNLTNAGVAIDGVGKTLAISANSARVVNTSESISNVLYVLGTTTVAPVVSLTGAPLIIDSASEYSVTLNDARSADNISEAITAGGVTAMSVGYLGTTATITISTISGTLTLSSTATGGAGVALPTTALTIYKTLNDVVNFINSNAGWTAAVGSGVIGLMPPTVLDQTTWNCGTDHGGLAANMKMDAYAFSTAISKNSALLQLGNPPAQALLGLPAVMALPAMLAGGTRGPTTSAYFTAAVDALQNINLNFVVPLFSQDATADIASGYTDSGSSYTILGINTYVKTHVLLMSTFKRRKNRQGFLSFEGSFAGAQAASSNIASFRCSMAFQDCKLINPSGVIIQHQAWATALLAAGMQAAGFYQSIFAKTLNANGFLQRAGDFNDQNTTQMETALEAGLLPAQKQLDGTYQFASDQTTYGTDNNFVYNSIQAVYGADVIALTLAQRMEKAFKGKSLADVSASIALAVLSNIMGDILRLKLTAPSSDAPKGWKNASINISGPVMVCAIEAKLATSIYFIPIAVAVSQVTSSASSASPAQG